MTTFHEIPIGRQFRFQGREYLKIATSMSKDSDRAAAIFLAETPVELLPGEAVQIPAPPRHRKQGIRH